ncbi:SlyX family protein [Cognatishimia sp. F0-27]|nr:SlyX family protein [Cognatishimia sp. F0-27]MCC1493934.1 SlyX family protein [Cognatishimia sp. F0-27]
MDRVEERVADLIRTVDDLSDTVARQAKDLALLNKHVSLLMSREAEREADTGGGAYFGDDRPPHY